MENVGQFIGEPATWRLIDEGLDGGDKRAVTRKPDCLVGPQAGSVEAGDFAEGVIAAAMSIAGQVIQEFQFAKHSDVSACAESGSEFGQSRDLVAQEMLAKSSGSKESGA